MHSVGICYLLLSCSFKAGLDRTWESDWLGYTEPGLRCILTLVGHQPNLFTPALLLHMFHHVSFWGPIFCIKELLTNVLASMSSTLELMALLCVHVGYLRNQIVEGINWGFPIFQQVLWFVKWSFIVKYLVLAAYEVHHQNPQHHLMYWSLLLSFVIIVSLLLSFPCCCFTVLPLSSLLSLGHWVLLHTTQFTPQAGARGSGRVMGFVTNS